MLGPDRGRMLQPWREGLRDAARAARDRRMDQRELGFLAPLACEEGLHRPHPSLHRLQARQQVAPPDHERRHRGRRQLPGPGGVTPSIRKETAFQRRCLAFGIASRASARPSGATKVARDTGLTKWFFASRISRWDPDPCRATASFSACCTDHPRFPRQPPLTPNG